MVSREFEFVVVVVVIVVVIAVVVVVGVAASDFCMEVTHFARNDDIRKIFSAVMKYRELLPRHRCISRYVPIKKQSFFVHQACCHPDH